MVRPTRSSLASNLLLPLLALAGLGACADAGLDVPFGDDDDPSTLAERLAQRPLTLGLAPSAQGSFGRVTAVALRHDTEHEVEVVIHGGALTVSLDRGALRLESLRATGGDLRVSSAVVPPDGLALTGISVELASPVAGQTTAPGSDRMLASAGCAVDIRWAVELDHGVVNLAPIRLSDLPFELLVDQDRRGRVTARLSATQPGAFWNWANIFELRDLELDLVADSEQPAPPVPGPVD